MTKTSLSDHFDGNRFFNPTLPKDFAPSRRSTIKMMREPRSRWPVWVENKGVPRLTETLGADEVAITFVNHATFLIQTGGISILTDPVWSEASVTSEIDAAPTASYFSDANNPVGYRFGL